MTHTFMRSSLTARVRVLAWSTTIIASAIGCSSEQSAGPTSVAAGDSLPIAGSPPATDSVPGSDSLAITAALPSAAIKGVPFGPYDIMNGYTTWSWGPAPFTVSLNGNTFANGVISQIAAARAIGHKLILTPTGGPRSKNITGGKFDLAKWKRRMDDYNTPAIKAAVAQGYADGTIIGNQLLNEPMSPEWGGVFNKALVDEMCRYAKKIFPTVPAGPIVVHWWRMNEKYKVCDFIIAQYSWDQPPLGYGTPGGKGDAAGWRDAALAQARKEGIAIVFSMNILNGGPRLAGCPLSSTGGPAPWAGHCRMSPTQIRDYGRTLGAGGCAMLMWMYEKTAWSKPANIQAFRDVAATLAKTPGRSCRRTA